MKQGVDHVERADAVIVLKSLLRLLLVMTLVIGPHLLRIPPWEAIAIIALGTWRITASRRNWPVPGIVIKSLLTVTAFVGVYASYGRIWGQQAGVALLVIMLGLKLTELKQRRDVVVTVFLLYFLVLTHFLFSQEIWTLAYLFACTIAITAVLADTHHDGGALPAKLVVRIGTRLILQSLPLAALMFVLFPRLPGPLWTLPQDAGAARSGLSDSMSPGDISRLALSDELAFRVRFSGDVPAPAERYWRGPVLWLFDGRQWTAPPQSGQPTPALRYRGPTYSYEVTLEPRRTPWLFGLDYVDKSSLPPNSYLSSNFELLNDKPVRDRLRYTLHSYPLAAAVAQLDATERKRLLWLPKGYNPRAIELAGQWREQAAAAQSAGSTQPIEQQIAASALRLFRNEAFYYDLSPPPLGRDSVDEFLYTTRRGFCEHYASSFTVLMRAAGVPARVVTGYLGAEKNLFGDHYVVRQSDAHAWSEIWVEGSGWQRVDPTAAVSPERVEQSFSALQASRLPAGAGLLGSVGWREWADGARNAWDWIDAQWNGWILGYGTDLQHDLLSRFGLGDWGSMLLALTGLVTAGLLILGALLLRNAESAPREDAALREWRRATRWLAQKGLVQHASEGPRDYTTRVAVQQPRLANALQAVLKAYLQLRYEPADTASTQQLRAAVDALRKTPLKQQ